MTYRYFCGNCGKHFASEKPERDSKGYLNEISYPFCGAHDTYPGTPFGTSFWR